MVHYLVMIRINVHEAKTHLSRYLKRLLKGETIVLCKRNEPIAEIRPLSSARTKRALGTMKGQFEVPASFFEALPPEVLDSYYGGKG